MRITLIGLILTLAGCASSSGDAPRILELEPQNDSEVVGNVTLTSSGEGRTVVEIDVDPAGHPDMPAHIHSGTCVEMIPQPVYPLENVRDGTSRTEIPVALSELLADPVVVNLHHSNDQMEISTACIELGDA